MKDDVSFLAEQVSHHPPSMLSFPLCLLVYFSGSVRVLEGFGELWELKMPFSRTWKVLKKKRLFKNGYGKFWVFVWKDSSHVLKWT